MLSYLYIMYMFSLFSVDEILQTKYKKWFTNFRELLFNEMAPSWSKHMNFVLETNQFVLVVFYGISHLVG